MQCVLVLIAVQKQAFWPTLFCGFGCKLGSNFLQREMQKHSKWQKVERRSTRSWPPFSSFCCILYRFCKVISSRMVRQKVAICKTCLPFLTIHLHASCNAPFGLRHVLTIPRKGSIVVPGIALHCLFAFNWHLSLTLSVA